VNRTFMGLCILGRVLLGEAPGYVRKTPDETEWGGARVGRRGRWPELLLTDSGRREQKYLLGKPRNGLRVRRKKRGASLECVKTGV